MAGRDLKDVIPREDGKVLTSHGNADIRNEREIAVRNFFGSLLLYVFKQ